MIGPTWTECDKDNPTADDGDWLSYKEWVGVCEMTRLNDSFAGFDDDFV